MSLGGGHLLEGHKLVSALLETLDNLSNESSVKKRLKNERVRGRLRDKSNKGQGNAGRSKQLAEFKKSIIGGKLFDKQSQIEY